LIVVVDVARPAATPSSSLSDCLLVDCSHISIVVVVVVVVVVAAVITAVAVPSFCCSCFTIIVGSIVVVGLLQMTANHPLNTHFLFLDHHREYTSNPEEIHNSFFVPESYGRNSDI
jgi:hypothetical protein